MELFNKVTAGRLSLPEKVRVNLLALGDVGSTLLLGLRLMGGDVISSMGICDVRENAALRWEFELNQIQPPSGAALPPVEIISPEQLFDGDVFLFCASRMVPDTSVTGGDVRMAQYGLNRELAASYARMARDRGYQGLFCVVSDPVDPLCRAVLRAGGGPDGTGLRPWLGRHARKSAVLRPQGPPLCRLPHGGPRLRTPRGGSGAGQFHRPL